MTFFVHFVYFIVKLVVLTALSFSHIKCIQGP